MPEGRLEHDAASARSERRARALLAAVAVCLVGGMALVDLPRWSSGRFWADGATYYSMAWSLARDFDLRYEARDLTRVRHEYFSGPDGVFLKRASGGLTFDRAAGFPWLRRVGPEEKRIYYAKAFLHPLVAAPFVAVLGTRGLLVVNALSLAGALALGYDLVRRRQRALPSLAAVLVLFLGSVAPVYLFWMQPELFNLALVTAALWAWARGRSGLSALLFGLATYSKPTNLLLALPLGVAPLLEAGRAGLWAGLRESLRRGLLLAVTAAALFAVNGLVTGEMNYQGGERKTFLTHFPFESPDVRFGNSGIWMTTEHVGPQTGDGSTSGQAQRGTIVRDASELPDTLRRNIGYFWLGRYAGVVPYFFPTALLLAGFLTTRSRAREGWLALAALCLSWWAFISLIPDNWYGGGGTVGNRYFLGLLPLSLLMVPARRSGWWTGAAALGSLVLVVPILAAPIRHSLEPWTNAQRPLLRALPLELTMLNDLGFCSDPWRKKRPFGDTEGDPQRGRPPDPRAYWLYFPDDGSYGQERVGGVEGFWLRRGARGEVLLRAQHPVRRVVVHLAGGPAGDVVRVRADAAAEGVPLAPFREAELRLEPGPGYRYYSTWVYTLGFESTGAIAAGPVPPGEGRRLGAFVRLELELDPDAPG